VATASNNQPKRGTPPSRQDPAAKSKGMGAKVDPTFESDQTPAQIFGFQNAQSTGLGGTMGDNMPSDVTLQPGQTDGGVMNLSEKDITDTGLEGGMGAQQALGSGQTVTYTDPFGVQGGINRDATAKGTVSGNGDWTQANADGYAGGPTIPILQGRRPTSTGLDGGDDSSHVTLGRIHQG
jgi:hypothetical protein